MSMKHQIEQLKQKRLGLNKVLEGVVGTNHSEFIFNSMVELLKIDVELAKMEQMDELFAKSVVESVLTVAETPKTTAATKTTVAKPKTASA